ncbi:hypothetical protein Tco_0027082 [Tanacetum coccineum]
MDGKVIVNGDAPAITSASAGTKGPIPPKTSEQKLARKNELKAKSTLWLAIPDEHLLKFHRIKDANTLWEAIKAMFGGNKESKKMQKTILKQQYENFAEDANLKLLRSLPSAWNNISLIMRNKSDLDTLSMDDLYNNLKVYESESESNQAQAQTLRMWLFPQLDNEDLEQIDTDDLEEMDFKWQVDMLTMRVKRFLKKTGRNLNFNGKETGNRNGDGPRRNALVDTSTINALVVQDGIGGYDWSFHAEEGITNFALMAYTSQGSSSSDSEREAVNKSNLEIIGYQMGLESLEARIVIHEKNEVVYEEDIAFLKYDVQVKDISIKDLKNYAKYKACLGYDSQINENEVVHSVFNSRESDVDDSPVNDKFKIGEEFHAVPPPYTGNYMPSTPDLSFAGLDDSVYKTKVSETETSISITSKDIIEKPKTVRPSALIIEDWDTDSDNDSMFRHKSDQTKPKFTKINFVKSDENVKSVNKENTYRQVEYPRKSQSPTDNRRNWNELMTQKLGNGFESIKKACFVCESFNHLIKYYDFHDKKMVEKPVLNNKRRVTGQREIRPVWNNAQRVNHQNKFTHPHPKRNFVPTVVVTKSGQVLVNTTKQSSPRAATSISTVRPVNTVAPKPKMNDALPTTYSYFKAHSPVKRAFNQKSAAKTNKFNEKVNTARVNNVTAARPKAVVSVAVGNGENVVKSSACWIWRPTRNVIDHTSKDNGSYMLKRFNYDKGIFDSGCSRHMTGNKSFLIDYQEIDGRFVSFGGSPKGASTLVETHKALLKDEEAEDVDVHLYRSMIGSLMYLTASRLDIMFVVCACAGFEVTPKVMRFQLLPKFLIKMPPRRSEGEESEYPFFEGDGSSSGKWKDYCVAGDDYEGPPIFDDDQFDDDYEGPTVFNDYPYEEEIVSGDVGKGFEEEGFVGKGEFGGEEEYIEDVVVVVNDLFSLMIQTTSRMDGRTCNIKLKCVKSQIPKRGQDTKIPQSGGPLEKVGDEAVHKELGDRMKMAATTASSLEVEIGVDIAMHKLNTTSIKIVDFLNSTHIKYALSENPTIYVSLIHQFWQTASTSTSENEEMEITATINGRVKTVTEASIRRHLKLEDSDWNFVEVKPHQRPLKFDGKADEGFFVGYSINSKAFRVFNTRLEGIKDNTQQYILLPLLYDSPKSSEDAVADDAGKKTNEKPANKGERNGQENEGGASNKEDDQNVQDFRAALDNLLVQQKEGYANSTNKDSTASPSVSELGGGAYDDEDVGANADLNNLETTINDQDWIIEVNFTAPRPDKIYLKDNLNCGLRDGDRLDGCDGLKCDEGKLGFRLIGLDDEY